MSMILTSEPIFMAWVKDSAPVGRIMNSCMASLLPAWEPPLITLRQGTGICTSSWPASWAMCWYRGMPGGTKSKWK